MARPIPSFYGTCPCTGTYEERHVEVRINVGDEPVVLDRVPQGACPACGSRVYKAEVIEGLEAVMRDRPVRRERPLV
jgi:YgiT-type zinc finger domain-containing protein